MGFDGVHSHNEILGVCDGGKDAYEWGQEHCDIAIL